MRHIRRIIAVRYRSVRSQSRSGILVRSERPERPNEIHCCGQSYHVKIVPKTFNLIPTTDVTSIHRK